MSQAKSMRQGQGFDLARKSRVATKLLGGERNPNSTSRPSNLSPLGQGGGFPHPISIWQF